MVALFASVVNVAAPGTVISPGVVMLPALARAESADPTLDAARRIAVLFSMMANPGVVTAIVLDAPLTFSRSSWMFPLVTVVNAAFPPTVAAPVSEMLPLLATMVRLPATMDAASCTVPAWVKNACPVDPVVFRDTAPPTPVASSVMSAFRPLVV
jgi:hypothetical protein